MKLNLNIGPKFRSSKLANYYNRLASSVSSARKATKEAMMQRYINLHDTAAYSPEAAGQIYSMRQAIASYARKENISVDVYSVSNIGKSTSENASAESRQIAISVRDNKSQNAKAFTVDDDVTKIYPKEARRPYLLDVRGEDTQTVETAKYYVNDSFLRHVFRSIESIAKSFKTNR